MAKIYNYIYGYAMAIAIAVYTFVAMQGLSWRLFMTMHKGKRNKRSGHACEIIVQDCFIRVATLAVLACLQLLHKCTS